MNRIKTAGRGIVALLGNQCGRAWLSRDWRVVVVATCLLATAQPVAAITFILNPVPGATNPTDPTGSGLMSIMQEAANRWSDIIEDNYTMTIDVSYATSCGPTAAACAGVVLPNVTLNRTLVGTVRFDPTLSWFIDPTPGDDSEFDFTQTLHIDLTSAQQTAGYSGLNIEPLLEVGFRGLDNGSDPNAGAGFDMHGTALHEIGHLLGVTRQLLAGIVETSDGDYDLPPSLLGGRTMAVEAIMGDGADPHFVDFFPLMNPFVGFGERILPTAADVLAAAAVSGWSQIDLAQKVFRTGTDWETAANWVGNRVPDIQDHATIRHGGSVDITTNAGVAGLFVGDSSQLTVQGTLIANGNVTIDGGVLTRDSTANFILSPSKTMTIENGGNASFIGDYNLAANATYTVTGAGSTWTNSGDGEFRVGVAGTSTLKIEDGGAVSNVNGYVGYSAGIDGDVTLTGAPSLWTNSSGLFVGYDGTGTLTIEEGARVHSSSGFVGLFAGSDGKVTVTGDSAHGADSTWTTSTLYVGGDVVQVQPGGTGYIEVLDGGLVQVSGDIKVWERGAIDVQTGGTLNANGNVTVNAGLLTRFSDGTFSLGAGKTMTVENGGVATFVGSYSTASNATYNITGIDSRLDAVVGSTLSIINGATVNVSSGGALFSSTTIHVGAFDGTNGTLKVDGPGSSATTSVANVAFWGFGGATATVTFQNNASGSFSQVRIANSMTAGTAGIVKIESGAQLTTSNLFLAVIGGATTSATLSVQGSGVSGSTVTQTGASTLTVGHESTGTAAINIGTVASGAMVHTGTGTTTINKTGTVTIGSGANTGTLNATGNVTIDDGVLTRASGSAFNLAAGKTMTVENSGTASFSGSYATASNAIYNITGIGSTLEAVGGQLSIINGAQVHVTSGGSLFATATIQVGFSNGTNGTLIVDGLGSNITTPGASAAIWGFGGATANVTFQNNASGSFSQVSLAHSTTGGTAGIATIQSGADLTFTNNLALAALGGATTSATLSVQGSGSTVTQTGGSTLTVGNSATGTAAINIGTTSSGAVFDTGTGLTTINKTGTVTIGNGANTGTLNADGNVTIDAGVLQVGAGSSVIVAPVKSMTLVNAGTLKGSGNVSGTVVNISGVVSPGTSPGTLSINGSYTQNAAGQLLIELASAASFDRLLTTDSISLAGTLDVDLLSFVPTPGNSFQIISATGGINGTFANVLLPTLSNANWQLLYSPTSMRLQVALPGDYNFDGTVDAADYVVWSKTLGQTGFGLAADGNANNQIDSLDYNIWRVHFGETAGSGSLSDATVPEPASALLLLLWAAAGVCLRSHAASQVPSTR